jgi:hypothetical protein
VLSGQTWGYSSKENHAVADVINGHPNTGLHTHRDSNDPAYKITHTVMVNQSVSATVLRGGLVELGSPRILDAEIGDDEIRKAFGSLVSIVHHRGVHFFSKVTVRDNTLILPALNNDWFMAAVLEEGTSLPCLFECRGGYCDALLTGTPRPLREFFLKFGVRPANPVQTMTFFGVKGGAPTAL